ncbi:APC family permease [Streptomyces clavuligerus]|uniref:Putative amino acid transporter n=1 Tax=Streptomyces clavuligerus TaxID=1901 RepID=E2Q152_STRCL|nr:APC family permease [Streptomyces clavuligerus]ANW18766.1 amino acid transporter [Streptomyces clavuligerus]AXU13332.1 APC family permease [Streptomyces clavuligerus]EFG08557.1 Putative amino acid transporter [Streptomyces clavuligerus]MBY6303287.1 APC family permease [Streptomyces clavuligerus]QCS06115.1 APC family permease [Streptomyces clavuligerus]
MTQLDARPLAGDRAEDVPGGTRGVRTKGLGGNSVGLTGSAVIGISTVAPVYCLTSTLGSTAGEVGLQMPAVFLAGFLPMLLVAFAYRELNRVMPDCGTSFTWTVKAFGPRVGWMCGWGLVIATIIVLSNLAGVATSFFWLLAGEITGKESIAALDDNKAVHIVTVLVFIAVATAISYRGMTATKGVQYALVGLQLLVLALFVAMALGKAGEFETSLSFSAEWLNPFAVQSFAAFTAGLSLSIFMYWGWDACLTANEETTGSDRTPGRAALIAMVVLVGAYLATGVAAQMAVGSGDQGLGLANPDTSDNVFAALAGPVMGPALGVLLFVAVLASAAASLQTTFIPVARTVLAMSAYEALPPSYARVHPRFRTPGRATVVAGLATGAFYTVMTLVSENVLIDTVYALGLMICFYYSLTAFACAWYFRRELLRSGRDLVFKGVFPLLGGTLLAAVFSKTLYDMWDPAYGSGSAVLGVGSVFVIGVGLLLLGLVIMLVMTRRSPAFFRGEILTRETPSLIVRD